MNQALDFLQQHPDVALATVEDNKPKVRVFRIMKQEGTTLYFATSKNKAVYRQLVANPNMEILAFEDDIHVRCVGHACFDVDDSTAQWIYSHNEVLSRLYSDYKAMEYFRMDIQEMDFYDLAPTPPLFRYFDLRNQE